MGDSNTQRKELQVGLCNGQVTIEISRSTRINLVCSWFLKHFPIARLRHVTRCVLTVRIESTIIQTRSTAELWNCWRSGSPSGKGLWKQATIEVTCHYHSIIACSHHIYECCSLHISCSWWVAHSTQRQRRGCNKSKWSQKSLGGT